MRPSCLLVFTKLIDKKKHERDLELELVFFKNQIFLHEKMTSSSVAASSTDEIELTAKSNQCGQFAKSILAGSTIATLDGALSLDYELLAQGHAIYIPQLLCSSTDFSLLDALMADLSLDTEVDAAFVNWSRHAKLENPTISQTFNRIVAALAKYFDFDVFATRLNFYRDNSAFKPFHHDSHAYLNNIDSHQSHNVKEDFTCGVSLGAARELVFKHVASGQQFAFPQGNGDCFSFDSAVNQKFQHGVPHAKDRVVGPRFSIIAWGRRRTLNERNAGTRDIGTRDPPLTPLRLPMSSDVIATHGPPTTEEDVDNKNNNTAASSASSNNNEVIFSIDDVCKIVSEFTATQREKLAAAEAEKAAAKQKANDREKKPRARVQGGWAKTATKR